MLVRRVFLSWMIYVKKGLISEIFLEDLIYKIYSFCILFDRVETLGRGKWSMWKNPLRGGENSRHMQAQHWKGPWERKTIQTGPVELHHETLSSPDAFLASSIVDGVLVRGETEHPLHQAGEEDLHLSALGGLKSGSKGFCFVECGSSTLSPPKKPKRAKSCRCRIQY